MSYKYDITTIAQQGNTKDETWWWLIIDINRVVQQQNWEAGLLKQAKNTIFAYPGPTTSTQNCQTKNALEKWNILQTQF